MSLQKTKPQNPAGEACLSDPTTASFLMLELTKRALSCAFSVGCFSRQLHSFISTQMGLCWSHKEAMNWDKVFTPKFYR